MNRLKQLAEVAILLPIAHIIICVIFLSGYIATFGGNVSSLFSITDSFTVTLGDILTIYTFTLGLPLLFKWYENEKRSQGLVQGDNDTGRIDSLGPVLKWIDLNLQWITLGVAVALSALLMYIRLGRQLPVQYLFPIQLFSLSLAFAFHRRLNTLGISRFNREILWLVVTGSLTAFGSGLWRGDFDRHQPYTLLFQSHYRCGAYVVIRSVSGRFLAVGDDETRYVIDESCKVMFTFPKSFTFHYFQ